MADHHGYMHCSPSEDVVLWKDREKDRNECMFIYVGDPFSLDMIEDIFKNIRKFESFFTYAFVNQKKDGEHCWDIFLFSIFSYLEHHNRIYAPRAKITTKS